LDYFYSNYNDNYYGNLERRLPVLLFLLGAMAGGLISMIIMAILFISAREEEQTERLFHNLTACSEKKLG